jgi:hypothetical protein
MIQTCVDAALPVLAYSKEREAVEGRKVED